MRYPADTYTKTYKLHDGSKKRWIGELDSVEKTLFVDTIEAFITDKYKITCYNCNGKGDVSCWNCSGRGCVRETNYNTNRDYYRTCPKCGGRGRLVCDTCDGHGELWKYHFLNIKWRTRVDYQMYGNGLGISEKKLLNLRRHKDAVFLADFNTTEVSFGWCRGKK